MSIYVVFVIFFISVVPFFVYQQYCLLKTEFVTQCITDYYKRIEQYRFLYISSTACSTVCERNNL